MRNRIHAALVAAFLLSMILPLIDVIVGSDDTACHKPDPAPLHTDSLQPRELPSWNNDVPPTAVTYDDEAG